MQCWKWHRSTPKRQGQEQTGTSTSVKGLRQTRVGEFNFETGVWEVAGSARKVAVLGDAALRAGSEGIPHPVAGCGVHASPLDWNSAVAIFAYRRVDQDSRKDCHVYSVGSNTCHCPASWPEQAYDSGDRLSGVVARVRVQCRQ
jgi:hypothetical protein